MFHKKEITTYIKKLYPDMDPVLLHCPQFLGNEKKYLTECIDTKYVSYVGRFVADMETKIKEITGVKHAIAMVNGTEALHLALIAVGVKEGDEVITQSLTFAATAAAIVHSGASPVFVDVDRSSMGMSPESLNSFLESNTDIKNGLCINKITGKTIRVVVPMHTFGHPVRIDEIAAICKKYSLILIEDSAESLGSYYKKRHTGTFGNVGVFSFNGNKLVTTGGGGMLITDDDVIAERVKYISTTAKRPHRWEFYHTEAGYNLRMPSLNAAVGLAQLEYFDKIISNKRETAEMYQNFFSNLGINCIHEPANSKSNYWLNALLLDDFSQREELLDHLNSNGVQARPVWTLMHKMTPYEEYQKTDMENSLYLEERVINIPSSVRTN